MKKTLSFFTCLLYFIFCHFPNIAQDTTKLKNTDVKELIAVKWNADEGLAYKQVPGANLGVVSFAMMDSSKIAFLSDASNEIIIAGTAEGKVLSRFSIYSSPRDFVYDLGLFYVLYDDCVLTYNMKGDNLNKFSFPSKYLGVERLARFSNSTFLLLPSGNCLKIEENGSAVTPVQFPGWITSSGDLVLTKISGDNSYSVKIISKKGLSSEVNFSTADKKVAGVYVVGSTGTKLVLDVQTYISESPIAVERKIVSIKRGDNGTGSISSSIKVPDCYYVLSNKEIDVSKNGEIYNMVTTPQSAFIFLLTETDNKTVTAYPAFITSQKYHFNDHLLQINEK